MFSKKGDLAKLICTLFGIMTAFYLSNPPAETVFLASNSDEKILPIFSVERDDKKIALTFNAAWGTEDLDKILETLKRFKVESTFFVCGYWAEQNPEAIKKIYGAGHEIANHGDKHAHVAQLSSSNNKKEISGAHEKVKEILGIEMNLFRPPYGEYNNTVVKTAESLGYKTIQWDVDSLDWKNEGLQNEIDRVLKHKKLDNGSIILFHVGTKYTAEALTPIIEGLLAKGFELVKVSEMIHLENYSIDNNGRQKLK